MQARQELKYKKFFNIQFTMPTTLLAHKTCT